VSSVEALWQEHFLNLGIFADHDLGEMKESGSIKALACRRFSVNSEGFYDSGALRFPPGSWSEVKSDGEKKRGGDLRRQGPQFPRKPVKEGRPPRRKEIGSCLGGGGPVSSQAREIH